MSNHQPGRPHERSRDRCRAASRLANEAVVTKDTLTRQPLSVGQIGLAARDPLVSAMARRRDWIVACVRQAQQPPAWAHALLGRATWEPSSPRAARDVVAKVAVYRERYAAVADGLGPIAK
jgi:hypothetical protein